MPDQAVVRASRWEHQKKRTPPRPPSVNDLPDDDTSRFDDYRNSLVDTATEDSVVDVVTAHWNKARQEMLVCGRYLARARDTFRGRFSTHIVPRLPFSREVAHKLAKVATLVDEGVIPAERLPENYSTAYLLLTLDKDALAKADHLNLVRPTVTRREVEAFRDTLRAERSLAAVRRDELRTKRLKLLDKRDQIDAEIRQLEAEMELLSAHAAEGGATTSWAEAAVGIVTQVED
jgi:hypothetical protein